jgi:ferredoxin
MARVVIDRANCQGHARCWKVAPELYQLDDEGYIATDGFSVAPEDVRKAQHGARACPERVVTFIAED